MTVSLCFGAVLVFCCSPSVYLKSQCVFGVFVWGGPAPRPWTEPCVCRSPSQESEMETEEEVDILMSSDVYSATLSTKSITFSRAQSGWLFREDKTVGPSSMLSSNLTVTVCRRP